MFSESCVQVGWLRSFNKPDESAVVTPDLTFRAMYEYNWEVRDHRVIAQLYYYTPL